MKHKTIVRLAVRLLGLYLLATGLPSALSQLVNMVVSTFNTSTMYSGMSWFGPNGQWMWMIPNVLYFGTQVGVGAYLLFGGKFVVNLIVPSNRPYCPECLYELRPPTGDRCPECGASLQHLAQRPNAAQGELPASPVIGPHER